MKPNIHPKYSNTVKARCACGHEFVTGSTKDELYVEICSACHPFYTGKQKLVDTARRVEKFEERKARITSAAATHKGKTQKHAEQKRKRIAKAEVTTDKKPKVKKEKKTKGQ